MGRVLAAFWILIACAGAAQAETLELESGNEARFLVTPAEAPVAVGLMMVGGSGRVKPDSTNFLVRSRALFAERGMTGVFVQIGDTAIENRDRVSDNHADDLAEIARHLRARHGLPVLGIGTSRGTLSVAALAVRHPRALDGLALTAALTRPKPGSRGARGVPEGIFSLALDEIAAPTVVLWHVRDGCPVTPPRDMARLVLSLAGADRVEGVAVTGGTPGAEPCKGLSHHGFLGVEDQAVDAIMEFFTGG